MLTLRCASFMGQSVALTSAAVHATALSLHIFELSRRWRDEG